MTFELTFDIDVSDLAVVTDKNKFLGEFFCLVGCKDDLYDP